MNQQMNLLEARAMAREREHQLRTSATEHRSASRSAARRLRLSSLGRRRAAQASGGRSTRVVAARG